MINFLSETSRDIKNSGHTSEDIIFIGIQESGHSCTWEEFQTLANRLYDNEYGICKVRLNLTIVFNDGEEMWRGEYDGSEWWEYCLPFEEPPKRKPLKNLFR